MIHTAFSSTSFTFHVPHVQATTSFPLCHPDPSYLHPFSTEQSQDDHCHALTAFGSTSVHDEHPVARMSLPFAPSDVSHATATITQNSEYQNQVYDLNAYQPPINPPQILASSAHDATHQALAGQSFLAPSAVANAFLDSRPFLAPQTCFIPSVPTPLPEPRTRKRKNCDEVQRTQIGRDTYVGLQDNVNYAITAGSSVTAASSGETPENDNGVPNGKRPKTRYPGTCPFCGQTFARDHKSHMGTHIGRYKAEDDTTPSACPFYSRKDGGVILYSEDGLTPEEIQDAKEQQWYFYIEGFPKKLIGPGKREKPKKKERAQWEVIKDGEKLRTIWLDHIEQAMRKSSFIPSAGWVHPETLPYPHLRVKPKRTKRATGSVKPPCRARKGSHEHELQLVYPEWSVPTPDNGSMSYSPSDSSSASVHVSTPQPPMHLDQPRLPRDWLQQDMPLLNPAAVQEQQQLGTYSRGMQEHNQRHPAPQQPPMDQATPQELDDYGLGSDGQDQRQGTVPQQSTYGQDWQGWYVEPQYDQVLVQAGNFNAHMPHVEELITYAIDDQPGEPKNEYYFSDAQVAALMALHNSLLRNDGNIGTLPWEALDPGLLPLS